GDPHGSAPRPVPERAQARRHDLERATSRRLGLLVPECRLGAADLPHARGGGRLPHHGVAAGRDREPGVLRHRGLLPHRVRAPARLRHGARLRDRAADRDPDLDRHRPVHLPLRTAPTAATLGYMIDLLAAVPSVVYGLWGGIWLVPELEPLYGFLNTYLG